MYKSRKQLNCTSCAKTLHGRIDKRFCSDACKNKHHRDSKKAIQAISLEGPVQSRNLIILLGIFGKNSKSIKLHKDLLFHYGFDINTFDRIISFRNKKYYCFQNFRFTFLPHGLIEIRRLENALSLSTCFYNRWKADFPEHFYLEEIMNEKSRNFSFERLSFFDSNKRLAY